MEWKKVQYNILNSLYLGLFMISSTASCSLNLRNALPTKAQVMLGLILWNLHEAQEPKKSSQKIRFFPYRFLFLPLYRLHTYIERQHSSSVPLSVKSSFKIKPDIKIAAFGNWNLFCSLCIGDIELTLDPNKFFRRCRHRLI